MNNRDIHEWTPNHHLCPETERVMHETLRELDDIAASTTPEDEWIIDTKTSRLHLSVIVCRRGSLAHTPAVKLRIDLQPPFPLRVARDWNDFTAQRQAKLDDAKALVENLAAMNVLKELAV